MTRYGAVQMRDTLSLAQTQYDGSIKCIVEDQLDPASLDILRDLKASAIKKWSEPRHPGWGIFRWGMGVLLVLHDQEMDQPHARVQGGRKDPQFAIV